MVKKKRKKKVTGCVVVPSSGFILLPRPVDLLVEGHGEGHSQELRRQNRKWRGGELAARLARRFV